jgi:protein SCO1/2
VRALPLVLLLAIQLPPAPAGRVEVTRYPNGALRSVAHYSGDVFDGLYQTWYPSGARYELKNYAQGRESGRQQAWTADGTLYLNYEVRGGRRFGLVNAKPCVATNGNAAELPFYTTADFTPEWTPSPPRALDVDLTSQSGERVTGAAILGQPHVAAFFFARCSTVCPTLVRQLKRVQDGTGIRVVAYSVTPAADTPAVLADYGRQHGIDPARWLLLTGDAATIYRAARTFYFAGDSRQPDGAAFLHTEKVLLVDGAGRLRGVYDGTLPHDVDRLIEDVTLLK